MNIIDTLIQAYYKDSMENLYIKYDNKFYMFLNRKKFYMNDIFCDLRDEHFKIIESEQDLTNMSFIAPELYYILEEVTIQN